jgi:AraC-like DNA-binding protein
MIFDAYNEFRTDPSYNKLVGKDYLFIEYKCPIETEKFQLLSESHFFMYVISGRKDWISSGRIFKIKTGDALFIKKGVYTTRQYLDTDHCVLLLFLNDDFIRDFMRENSAFNTFEKSSETDPFQIFQLEMDDLLKSLFYGIFNYLKIGRDIPTNLVELKFRELLFNIVLNPKHQQVTDFFSTLNQLQNYNLDHVMMNNFQHDLQLEEFAKLCNRSLSSFKRDFKNHYNQTPGKWLTEKRLEYARNLLVSSDLNVNEVCFESGFKNNSHFNKSFKDKYQLPPRKFRQMHKKDKY